jgi:hypothetical protein
VSDTARRGRAIVLIALFGALWFGVATEAAYGLMEHRRWDWAGMTIRGLLWGFTMGLVQAAVLTWAQRPGERRARRELEQWRTTGTLPASADPEQLLRYLEEQRPTVRVAPWFLLVATSGLAVLVAVAASTVNDDAPTVWALAVAVAVLGLVGFRWMRGRLARVDSRMSELRELSR